MMSAQPKVLLSSVFKFIDLPDAHEACMYILPLSLAALWRQRELAGITQQQTCRHLSVMPPSVVCTKFGDHSHHLHLRLHHLHLRNENISRSAIQPISTV